MKFDNETIKDALVTPGHVSEKDFQKALEATEGSQTPVWVNLISNNKISEDNMFKILSELLDVKYIDPTSKPIDQKIFTLIPEEVARHTKIVALERTEEGVEVGMADPANLEAINMLEKRFGEKVIPNLVTERKLLDVFSKYGAGAVAKFKDLLSKLEDDFLEEEERDELIVKMVDMLISYGYENQASDIHIEPYEEKVVVRFRIDGIMHDIFEVPKGLLNIILTRIKIMARMRTDEHRAAQDGKFRFKTKNDDTADVRVSIVPVVEGENAVMRLLSSKSRQYDLADLGLGEKNMKTLNRAIANPHGMILVTGPTGSGKTTTVYSVLKILNKREIHISTIEDPVEYDIEGISQIQVDNKTGLTFAKGLRSIVRQDPDIIMVGEMRDEETSGIAVNSAMTGHLVLSTLHANDAATTLPRLLDMGIEPFLVSSTVNVIIAQRLLRKICDNCRYSDRLNKEEIKLIKQDKAVHTVFEEMGYEDLSKTLVFRGKGCKSCGTTGYEGRIGIFELLEMNPAIKGLIIERGNSDQIQAQAKKEGMTTMLEDGVSKILDGTTTVEEVLRVTKG